jgi:hypothetical protein
MNKYELNTLKLQLHFIEIHIYYLLNIKLIHTKLQKEFQDVKLKYEQEKTKMKKEVNEKRINKYNFSTPNKSNESY